MTEHLLGISGSSPFQAISEPVTKMGKSPRAQPTGTVATGTNGQLCVTQTATLGL